MKNYGKVHDDFVSGMVFSNNSKTMFTCSWDKSIRRWEVEKFCCHSEYENAHDDHITCIMLDRTDRYLFSGGLDKHLKQWRLDQGIKCLRDFGVIHELGINC